MNNPSSKQSSAKKKINKKLPTSMPIDLDSLEKMTAENVMVIRLQT